MGGGKASVHGWQVGNWVPNLRLVFGKGGWGKFGTAPQGRIIKGKKGPSTKTKEGPAQTKVAAKRPPMSFLSPQFTDAAHKKAPMAEREIVEHPLQQVRQV
jgi:hypothetical protein